MDTYEATKIVMSRIQALDPDNASKIMGYILIQDQGEKEMLRLAFGSETLLISYMNQAKVHLGLVSSNTSSSSTNPIPINNNNHHHPFPQGSPRILVPQNNGFHHLTSPRSSPRPISYASVLNGGSNSGSGSSGLNFYGGNDFGDEFLSRGGVNLNHNQPFFDDSLVNPIMSPSGRSDSLVFPYGGGGDDISSPHSHHPFHRRSCSVNDAAFLSNLEEMGGGGGFGWRPCMYYNRGFCKNGTSCKFLHSDNGEPIEMGSPSKEVSGFDDFLRMKAFQQQQRLALMASGGHNPFSHSKFMSFMNENPRNDFSPMGLGVGASSSSRQIYLTFPADSTFKEEDVSGYFSIFGPVQDVRIPYQQKRMFGFVTFVFPETVKSILAKGNPHFVCESRVLVKPYKEKGKICERKQLQSLERGEFLDCLSPSGLDSREQFDSPFGPRMLMTTQEMMLRKKMEQEVELQHAIELQGRRMMNLQLMDLKNQHRNHPFLPSFLAGGPISSPRLLNQNVIPPYDFVSNQEVSEGVDHVVEAKSLDVGGDHENLTESSVNNNTDLGNNQQNANANDADFPESLEHVLPDNLFASPKKSAAENDTFFSQSSVENDANSTLTINNTPSLPSSSPLGMESLKPFYYQTPSH